jgi:nitric oxide reductase NorQ protein
VWPEYAAHVAGLFVTLYGNPDAPTVDPTYIFQPAHLAMVLAAASCAPTLRIWAAGPRGTGKTEFARQFAARTGRPLYRVNFNRATEASEVIGDQGLQGGNTQWVDGPVAAACRVEGALLLLDEITYSNPGNLSALNPLLEANGAHLRLPRTSETLSPPASMLVMAADNTTGFGDATGEYAARNVIGSDTRDRFSVTLQFDYLPAAAESKLLRTIVKRATGKKMLTPVANAIVKVMTVARTKSQNGELSGAPSLRGSAAFATLLAYGVPVADAYTACIVMNAPQESGEELRQIFAAHWPADLLNVPPTAFFA